MELLARHAVEELNSETQRSGLDALAAVSNKAVPSRNLDASLKMSDSNRMVEKNKVVEEEDDPEFEDDETGSIEYEYCNQDYSNSTHDGAHPKKRRVKSMYKGVFKCGKKFKAQIQTRGVQHYLGLYDSEEEAARAYDTHARLVLGAKAKTNFPYDLRDAIPEPFLPLPATVSLNLRASSSDEENRPSKRSYIGIKSRKRTKDAIKVLLGDAATTTPAITYLNHLNPSVTLNSAIASNAPVPTISGNGISSSSFGHTLIHLPAGLSQTPYLVNSLPSGYTPLMHPAAQLGATLPAATSIVPPLALSTSSLSPPGRTALPITTSTAALPVATSSQIDWSKQAYVPLEITGAYSYSAVTSTQEEPDWRDQIYYWVGNLSFDDNQECLQWSGKWMGSFSGRPIQSEFDSSSNEFTYYSPHIEKSRAFSADGLLLPLGGNYSGQYSMDNDGSGVAEMYTDKELLVEFEEVATDPYPQFFVFGRGDSEFGEFVVHGSFDSSSGLLEMSRQYLPENDSKKDLSMQQLKTYLRQKYY